MGRVLLALILIGGICGILLVATAEITQQPIAYNRAKQARAIYTDILHEPLPESIALDQTDFGNCSHWLITQLSTNGYSGEIQFVALWRPPQPHNKTERNAQLGFHDRVSLRVLHHLETPGIGDFIDNRHNTWLPEQDNHLPVDWLEVDNVSGATITTQAVQRAASNTFIWARDKCRDD